MARLVRVVEDHIPAWLMAVTVSIVALNVIMRYVFGNPIQGVSEIALITFIWQIYLAAAGVMRRGQHIAVGVIVDRFTPRWRSVADVLIQLLLLSVLAYLCLRGVQFVADSTFSPLPSTGLSKRYLAVAVPISAAMMAMHVLGALVVAVRGAVRGVHARTVVSLNAELDASGSGGPTGGVA